MAPSTTQAQAWLADRSRAEGHGIRVGDLEVHPGIGAEFGVQSNPFLESGDEASEGTLLIDEDVKPSAMLRLTPHLFVSTLGRERLRESDGDYRPPDFAFRGGLSGSLEWFGVGPGGPGGSDIGQARYVGELDLKEDILPERPFSLGFEQEARVTQLPVQGRQSNHYHGGAGAQIEVGTRGRLLRGRFGYKFNVDRYDASQNDGHDHNLKQGLTWQFLPRTALFQELELRFRSFQDAEATSFLIADKQDSTGVAARFGLNGAISKAWSATIALGYGAVFFDGDSAAEEKEDVIGQVQINYRPSERVTTGIGYGRLVGSALQGNTVLTNNVFVHGSVVLGGAFILSARADVRVHDYGADRQQTVLSQQLQPGQQAVLDRFDLKTGAFRSDTLLSLDLNGEYRLSNWLALTGEVRYDADFSDYAFLVPSGVFANNIDGGDVQVGFASPIGFTNITGVLGIRAFL